MDMDIDRADSNSAIRKHAVARRRLVLKTLSGSALFGSVVEQLPGIWQRPLIYASVLPAHAQVSEEDEPTVPIQEGTLILRVNRGGRELPELSLPCAVERRDELLGVTFPPADSGPSPAAQSRSGLDALIPLARAQSNAPLRALNRVEIFIPVNQQGTIPLGDGAGERCDYPIRVLPGTRADSVYIYGGPSDQSAGVICGDLAIYPGRTPDGMSFENGYTLEHQNIPGVVFISTTAEPTTTIAPTTTAALTTTDQSDPSDQPDQTTLAPASTAPSETPDSSTTLAPSTTPASSTIPDSLAQPPVLRITSVAMLDADPVTDLSFPLILTEAAVAAATDKTIRLRLAVTGLATGEAMDVHFTLTGNAHGKNPLDPDAAYDYDVLGADFIPAEQRYRLRAQAVAPEVEFSLIDLAARAPGGEATEVLVVILDARPGDGYQVDTGRNSAVIEFRDTILLSFEDGFDQAGVLSVAEGARRSFVIRASSLSSAPITFALEFTGASGSETFTNPPDLGLRVRGTPVAGGLVVAGDTATYRFTDLSIPANRTGITVDVIAHRDSDGYEGDEMFRIGLLGPVTSVGNAVAATNQSRFLRITDIPPATEAPGRIVYPVTTTVAPTTTADAVSPTTTAEPTTTIAPTTTAEPTTTISPTTTAEPTTTIAPTTTAEPTTTIAPTTTIDQSDQSDPSDPSDPTTTIAPTTTAEPTTTIAPTTTVSVSTTPIPTTTAEPTTTAVPTTTAEPTAAPTTTAEPTTTIAPTTTIDQPDPSDPSDPSDPTTTIAPTTTAIPTTATPTAAPTTTAIPTTATPTAEPTTTIAPTTTAEPTTTAAAIIPTTPATPTTPQTAGFKTRWMVHGSAMSISIPINPDFAGQYDYVVDWGDGTMAFGQTGAASHTYAATGEYTVTILGDFPAIRVTQNHIQRDRLLAVEQWGDQISWRSMREAFLDAPNVKIEATDTPDLSQVTDCSRMFQSVVGNSFVPGASQNSAPFTGLGPSAHLWDVSRVTNMERMFAFCVNFNQDLGNWDISSVTNMNGMFIQSGLGSENYDRILNGWAALPRVQSGLRVEASDVNFAGIQYTYAAVAAREKLTTDGTFYPEFSSWTINDGGQDLSVRPPSGVTGERQFFWAWSHLRTTSANPDGWLYTVSGEFRTTSTRPVLQESHVHYHQLSAFEDGAWLFTLDLTGDPDNPHGIYTEPGPDGSVTTISALSRRYMFEYDTAADTFNINTANRIDPNSRLTTELSLEVPPVSGTINRYVGMAYDENHGWVLTWRGITTPAGRRPGRDLVPSTENAGGPINAVVVSATPPTTMPPPITTARRTVRFAPINGVLDFTFYAADDSMVMGLEVDPPLATETELSLDIGSGYQTFNFHEIAEDGGRNYFTHYAQPGGVSTAVGHLPAGSSRYELSVQFRLTLDLWVQYFGGTPSVPLTISLASLSGYTIDAPDRFTITIEDARPTTPVPTTPGPTTTAAPTTTAEPTTTIDQPDPSDPSDPTTTIAPTTTADPTTTITPTTTAVSVIPTTTATPTISPTAGFKTRWKLSNRRALNLRINPDFAGQYDYIVDWGDGNINYGLTDSIEHAYTGMESGDEVTVTLLGEYPSFQALRSLADLLHLIAVEQWGDAMVWKSMHRAFDGARNVQIEATDTPNLSRVTDCSLMFQGVDGFELFGEARPPFVNLGPAGHLWDMSGVRTMENMFSSANHFNGDIGDWNVSGAVNMSGMFAFGTQFNQDLSRWDISNVTDMRSMFFAVGLSVENWSNILIGWAALPRVQSGVEIQVSGLQDLGFPPIQYTHHAAVARAKLTTAGSAEPNTFPAVFVPWTINDGGQTAALPERRFFWNWSHQRTTLANPSGWLYEVSGEFRTTSTDQILQAGDLHYHQLTVLEDGVWLFTLDLIGDSDNPSGIYTEPGPDGTVTAITDIGLTQHEFEYDTAGDTFNPARNVRMNLSVPSVTGTRIRDAGLSYERTSTQWTLIWRGSETPGGNAGGAHLAPSVATGPTIVAPERRFRWTWSHHHNGTLFEIAGEFRTRATGAVIRESDVTWHRYGVSQNGVGIFEVDLFGSGRLRNRPSGGWDAASDNRHEFEYGTSGRFFNPQNTDAADDNRPTDFRVEIFKSSALRINRYAGLHYSRFGKWILDSRLETLNGSGTRVGPVVEEINN